MPEVKFSLSSIFEDSVIVAARTEAKIIDKLENFKNSKQQNPLSQVGKNDENMVPNGPYAKALGSIRKCKLTVDYGLIYKITGSRDEGYIIMMYGVFSHADLGTGGAGGADNLNKQKGKATQLSNVTFPTDTPPTPNNKKRR